MTTILSAKPLVASRTEFLKNKVLKLRDKGVIPKMRVILVGENPASLVYVGHKQKMCQKIGCEFELRKLPSSISKKDFLNETKTMNQDPSITGCFVQLPVPDQLKSVDVTELIAPEKDVDGFGAPSIVDMFKGKDPLFVPCTPKGILALLDYYGLEVSGKTVTVIGRSLIVGKPISLLLQNRGATVSMCHSKTPDLSFFTKSSDIIISAVGRAHFLNEEFFRKDKSQVLVDVGMNTDANGKLCGDMDFESVKENVKAITPVPGGVGPLTVLSLMENLVLATENKLKEN